MKTFLFGSLKGCLISILCMLLFFAFFFMVIFDVCQIITKQRSYFFDFHEVKLYDAPIFTDHETLLVENLENKNIEIAELKNYFLSILPPDLKKINIELSKNKVEALCIKRQTNFNCAYNHDIKSKYIDSLLNTLNWNAKTFNTLQNKLKSANCISISAGNNVPVRIGHINGKSGMFLYNFFEDKIEPSLFQELSDSCTFKYHKENIFFEYAGKGRGPDCKHTTNHKNTEKSIFEKWRHLIQTTTQKDSTYQINLKDEDFVPF